MWMVEFDSISEKGSDDSWPDNKELFDADLPPSSFMFIDATIIFEFLMNRR